MPNTKRRTLSFPFNIFKKEPSAKNANQLNIQNPNSVISSINEGRSLSLTNGEEISESDNLVAHSLDQIQAIFGNLNLVAYPMVVLGSDTDFSCEGFAVENIHENTQDEDLPYDTIKFQQVENINDQNLYEKFFIGKEHYNYVGKTVTNENFFVSVLFDNSMDHVLLRYVLRLKDGNYYGNIQYEELKEANIGIILEKIEKNLKILEIQPVQHPQLSLLATEYDNSLRKNTFTFALLYQRFGQISEKEIYNNTTHGKEFDEFLEFLGRKVKLKDFDRFRGGLDTISDCTGEYSIYESFDNTEIMFHVSTLLPHSTKNEQQLERKRHIGNDRVAIVFQEENTPFSPTMINSKLIQVYLIIQPVNQVKTETNFIKRYKISIVSRNGAPYFGPYLYKPYVFVKDENLKKFIYEKLINAEYASLKLFHSFNEQIIKPNLQRICDKLIDLTQIFNSFKRNELISPSLSLKQKQIQKKTQVRSPVKRITSKFGFLQPRSNTQEEVVKLDFLSDRPNQVTHDSFSDTKSKHNSLQSETNEEHLGFDTSSQALNRIIKQKKSLSDEALDGSNDEAKTVLEKFKSLNTLHPTNET